MKITLATDFLTRYPEGGGLWSWFLDYPLGLKALGHDVLCLDVLRMSKGRRNTEDLVLIFFERARQYGLEEQCALLLAPEGTNEVALETSDCRGMSAAQIRQRAAETDVLWNFAGGLQGPLLMEFQRRVFLDGDPGHLHVSALGCDFSLDAHQVFLTAGMRLADAECEVPRLGHNWQPFLPFVHLPLWPAMPAPDAQSPITTVTQWNWGEIWWGERPLSISKRDAYLRYIDLPRRSGRPFELAANLEPNDGTGDFELLQNHDWRLVHPHEVAASPETYQAFIGRSRAELCCPKPVYRELQTGWVSERSAHYLAAGRPVLAEDTGFTSYLPAGKGLFVFRNMDEALAAVREIDADYPKHCRAARELAEEYLDAKKNLARMLEMCG